MSKPNIVVLDGHALNPGDLSWEPLEVLGNLTVYDRTPSQEVSSRARDAEIVLTNKSLLGAAQLQDLPKLKFISVLATGVNTVDLSIAEKRHIVVSNVVGYSTFSVAQHTFALLLELKNRVGHHSAQALKWSQSSDWSYWDFPLMELKGKHLGVIGLGHIGQQVASIGQAFGMTVLGVSGRSTTQAGVTFLPLDALLAQSDVISLNCPLTPDTHHLINKARLSTMKPSALLINTARGPLINELDLKWALENQVIAAAALDVLSSEPPPEKHPLLNMSNCLVTPHQAWASLESRSRLMDETVKNVKSFLQGTPRNQVTVS